MAHSAVEWEQQRPLISKLYFEQKKTLKEVREILAKEHKFDATERTYKTRIKLWCLHKKNKEHEIRAAVRLAVQRQRDGLNPVSGFQIGQRKVSWSEIRRYLRRKGIKDSSLYRWIAEVPKPRSYPLPSSELVQHSQPASSLADANDQAPLPPPACMSVKLDIPPFLSFRKEDFFVERLLKAMHVYNDSEFYTRNNCVRHVYDVAERGRTAFRQLIDHGLRDLSEKRYETAFHYFDRAFEQIRKLVEQNNPRWLLDLFGHMAILLRVGLKDLVLHLVRYLISISSIVHGNRHPLYVMADSFIRLPQRFLDRAADSALCSIATIVKSRSEPLNAVLTIYDTASNESSTKWMSSCLTRTAPTAPITVQKRFSEIEWGKPTPDIQNDILGSGVLWACRHCDASKCSVWRTKGCLGTTVMEFEELPLWNSRTRHLGQLLSNDSDECLSGNSPLRRDLYDGDNHENLRLNAVVKFL